MRIPAIFAPMLRERAICLGLFGAGILLVTANMFGVSLWRCFFHDYTGMPCPGCGLTRGMSALARGDLAKAVAWHPFTPLFAFGAALMLTATVLPLGTRTRLADVVEAVERRTGITLILIGFFVAFGVWRMIVHPHWA